MRCPLSFVLGLESLCSCALMLLCSYALVLFFRVTNHGKKCSKSAKKVRKAGQKASKDANFCQKGINFCEKHLNFLQFFAVFYSFFLTYLAQSIQPERVSSCVFDCRSGFRYSSRSKYYCLICSAPGPTILALVKTFRSFSIVRLLISTVPWPSLKLLSMTKFT